MLTAARDIGESSRLASATSAGMRVWNPTRSTFTSSNPVVTSCWRSRCPSPSEKGAAAADTGGHPSCLGISTGSAMNGFSVVRPHTTKLKRPPGRSTW